MKIEAADINTLIHSHLTLYYTNDETLVVDFGEGDSITEIETLFQDLENIGIHTSPEMRCQQFIIIKMPVHQAETIINRYPTSGISLYSYRGNCCIKSNY